jgi:hypothetical protein
MKRLLTILCVLMLASMWSATASAQALSGTYYIPKGANPQGYTTLADAITALNANGCSGTVTWLIDGNLTETADLVINRPDLTAVNNLVIKPNATKTPTITITKSPATGNAGGQGFTIENTCYVTIDGSNTVGGTTQDLTFNLNDATAIYALGIIDSSRFISMKNVKVTVTAPATGGTTGIGIDGYTAAPENVVIDNCTVGTPDLSFRTGIGLWGNASGTPFQGVVKNSTVYARRRAITTFYIKKTQILNNTLTIVKPDANQGFYCAVYITGGDATDTTTIYGNKIPRIDVNTTTAPSAASPKFATGVVMYGYAGVVNIVNNFFAMNTTQTGTNTAGQVLAVAFGGYWGGGVCNVINNTFRMTENTLVDNNAAVGIDMLGWTPTAFTATMKNNIVVSERNNATASVFYFPSSLVTVTSDYNLFKYAASGYAGNYLGTSCPTLTDWINTSFQDLNSKSAPVQFVSVTDLHLAGASIGDRNLTGTPFPEWPKDIDGQNRSTTLPYMGADEASTPLAVETMGNGIPERFTLSQNFPNPFNPSTQIQFALTQGGFTTLKVYDLLGRETATLVSEVMNAGTYQLTFDANRLTSGTYVYVLTSGTERLTRKMTLVK